MPYNFVPDSFT